MNTITFDFPDRSLYDRIVNTYRTSGSVEETAGECHVSECEVHRILVTENIICTDFSLAVKALYDLGYTPGEISRKLNRTKDAVEMNLPYKNPTYGSHKKADEGAGKDLVLKLHLELVGDFYAGADPNLDMQKKDREDLFTLARAQDGISRDILVPGDMDLHALHYAIQKLFGWQNSHLHHFALPQKTFDDLTEGKLLTYLNWCGTLFCFPNEDVDDVCWDDDYEDGMSFGGWLRNKYRRPYRCGSVGESYLGNEWEIEEFFQAFPQIKPEDTLQSLSEKIVFDQDFNTVIERLTAGEFFLPDALRETNLRKWKEQMEVRIDDLAVTLDLAEADRDTLRDDMGELRAWRGDPSPDKKEVQHWENRCKKILADWNVTLDPFFPELYYLYDYGDGWSIRITVTERQQNRLAYEAMNGNPVCVKADGLNLMDDCGGVDGYLDMLRTMNGRDPEEAAQTTEWARSSGWTGRMNAPERML